MSEFELEKFQAVCPACSHVFDLYDETMYKGWDDERDEEFIVIGCPNCDYQKQFFDLKDETEI